MYIYTFQGVRNGGIALMAAEVAAKAQNSPALQRAAAARATAEESDQETESKAPSQDNLNQVELEVAIDTPSINAQIAQL